MLLKRADAALYDAKISGPEAAVGSGKHVRYSTRAAAL